ncbi:uncharacterized protein P884DRAFT_242113 [Thermothelomyces heterothallicus CBS 202.75]|uniref:uncharacterized protein n=1 Tax=Thermothelomyces heterothallicus CBS 202.75 TaxID=1149848 RepID=UPI003743D98A
MASVDGDIAASLASQTSTPIAQLSPDLPDYPSRVVRGVVTITWPYNSVTQKFAFLLAERDVRLRRAKGQIRIELQGLSAKAASDCGIGAGDELLFSLAGAEWSPDPAPGRIPGARVEWQIQFSQKLALQVKFGESGDTKHINVDHPVADKPDRPVQPPRPATPDPEPILPRVPTTGRKLSEITADEYPSPAFVKRARLSYGALFEGGFDIFEEDGGFKGRGRKRARFGRNSNTWRYSSQSPSPEPTSLVSDAMDEDTPESVALRPSPTPQTVDEACQTVEVEMAPAAQGATSTTVQQEEKTPTPPQTPVPAPLGTAVRAQEGRTPEPNPVHQIERPPIARDPSEEPTPVVQNQTVAASDQGRGPASNQTPPEETHRKLPSSPIGMGQTQRHSPETATQPTSLSANNDETAPSSFLGPMSFASNFSSFGVDVPARVESSLSLADQVRFGFSHVPQTAHSPSLHDPEFAPEPCPEPVHQDQEQYPAALLDNAHSPAKYVHKETYLNAAGGDKRMAFDGQSMPPEPAGAEHFGDSQWEVSTQPFPIGLAEGGHFGTDAPSKGASVIARQQSLHADDLDPGSVPEGFASYGKGDASKVRERSPSAKAPPHERQPSVENENMRSDDEGSFDEEEEEDEDEEEEESEEEDEERSDEDVYGEHIEEGDYDQRNYDVPSDEDEGLSDEDEEIELESEERYGNDEVYDEDGEGEEWDDEEDYESEESSGQDDDAEGYQPGRPVAPAPRGEPVVISLLSDSEDEDQPAPPAAESAPDPQTAHASEPSVTSESSPSLKRAESSSLEHHKSPSSARYGSPSSPPHESPSPPRHDVPTSEHRQSPASERSESPAVLETVETDDSGKEQEHNSIFNQTDVIDFAMRHTQSVNQQRKAEPKETGAEAGSSLSANQNYGSFGATGGASELHHRDFEPEPNESPSGSVASEPVSRPASSESSSEGLFISQPRPRSAGAEEQGETGSASEPEGASEAPRRETEGTEGGTTDEHAEPDEASADGGMELEPENTATRDEVLSVEEMDQDVPAHSSPKSHNDDASLPDADALSFTSQIEMPVEFGASEDEHMSMDDDDSRHANAVDTDMSTFEVEEVTVSEEDVDMLDAGSEQVESALPERMAMSPQKEDRVNASTVVSDLVVSETITEVVTTASADEPLPDAPTVTELEQQGTSTPGEQTLARAESAHVSVEDESNRQVDVPEAKAEKQVERGSSLDGSHSIAGFESQVDIASQEALGGPRKPLAQIPVDDAVPPPAEHLCEADENPVAKDETTDDKGGAEPSGMESPSALQQDGVTDASTPPRPPRVVAPDGSPSSDQPEVALARAEDVKGEDVNEAEGSAQRAQQVETVQQSEASAEDFDDEALILEQLSQEQQQFLETETPESRDRGGTRSSSPDVSVHLARQAIAAKRHKKTTEPVRTSSRIARARSNSLRSNATNSTPEDEKEKEDPSIGLARAALASPSRRGVGSSTSASKTTATSSTSATALRADLNKRLRTELPECIPLRSLRAHLDKTPNVIAVVTSQPTKPVRAKGGPREYVMSFHVTDPSAAPSTVVEVQLYRPHKDSLPIVGPGDVVLLSKFLVKALSKKGWGLRTGSESAWAVWEHARRQQQQQQQQHGEEDCPQIRGPPVEDWKGYVGYVRTLKEWWVLMMADEAAKGKLEKADQKLTEAK